MILFGSFTVIVFLEKVQVYEILNCVNSQMLDLAKLVEFKKESEKTNTERM